MYGIDNLVEEALAWYDVQKHKPLDDNSLGMIELVKQTTMFPAVRKAIFIALTLPATSCTVEIKVLQHTAQGKELVKINDEWYTSVRPLHAKCPPQQSEQPEDRANEQGHWQFRKRTPTAPIPVPSVRTCSNWMNCWKMFMLFYSCCIFHVIFWNFSGGQLPPCPPPPGRPWSYRERGYVDYGNH